MGGGGEEEEREEGEEREELRHLDGGLTRSAISFGWG